MAPGPKPREVRPVSRLRLWVGGTALLVLVAPIVTWLARDGSLPMERHPIFDRLFAFNDAVQSLAMLAALLLAWVCAPMRRLVEAMALVLGERPGLAAGLSFVGLALGARFVYLSHPLSMDEYVPWLQAHAYARGQLAMSFPPELLDRLVPKSFQGSFVLVDHASGQAASVYWPGLALFLLPLTWLEAGWCLNPAFGALSLWLLHRLATQATGGDVRAGGWAMLAALASPQFVVNAMSWYAMPGELALNLLFLYCLLQASRWWVFLAGGVGGLALLMHNPMPHALMAVPCFLWLCARRARWPRLLSLCLGYLPLGAGVGLGWWLWRSGFGDLAVAANHHGASSAESPLQALAGVLVWPDETLLKARWQALWKVWIWACPGLLLIPLLSRRWTLVERLLLAGFGLSFVFYLFVRFDQGHGWGYRYIHPVWAALPLVAGVWIVRAPKGAVRWGAGMVVAGLLALPIFLWQTRSTIEQALAYRLEPRGEGDWIVFVNLNTGRYRGDLVQNPGGLRSPLYLASQGPRADRVLMTRLLPEGREVLQDSRGSVWQLPAGGLQQMRRDPLPAP